MLFTLLDLFVLLISCRMMNKNGRAVSKDFWCSIFPLPKKCFTTIESLCSAFLWSGNCTDTHKAKVSWNDDLCYPKSEGGLGLRSLKHWSRVFALKLIWHLCVRRHCEHPSDAIPSDEQQPHQVKYEPFASLPLAEMYLYNQYPRPAD